MPKAKILIIFFLTTVFFLISQALFFITFAVDELNCKSTSLTSQYKDLEQAQICSHANDSENVEKVMLVFVDSMSYEQFSMFGSQVFDPVIRNKSFSQFKIMK